MNDYERGVFDALDLLASAWHGKQYYFLEDADVIYSRDSRKYLTLDAAIAEFAKKIGDDGSI